MARSLWLFPALVLLPAGAQAQTLPEPAPYAPAPSVAAPVPQAPYVTAPPTSTVMYYYPSQNAYPLLQPQLPAPVKAAVSPRRVPYHGGEISAGATVIAKGHKFSSPTARIHAPGPRWALLPGAPGAPVGATLQITRF